MLNNQKQKKTTDTQKNSPYPTFAIRGSVFFGDIDTGKCYDQSRLRWSLIRGYFRVLGVQKTPNSLSELILCFL